MKRMKVEGYDVVVVPADGQLVAYVPALPGCIVQCGAEEKDELVFRIARAIGNYLLAVAAFKMEKELLPPRMKPMEKLKLEIQPQEEEM